MDTSDPLGALPALNMPAQAPSLYEQVYASLLEAICGGSLRPGDRINQDELAARLNVSRQPVTQALTVLRSQDFVQDTGRRGLVVTPFLPGDSLLFTAGALVAQGNLAINLPLLLVLY